MANEYIRWFWTEYDILEIIENINSRNCNYVATTWRIAFEIKERYNDERNITHAVKQNLIAMEEAGMLKQAKDVSSNLIWEIK